MTEVEQQESSNAVRRLQRQRQMARCPPTIVGNDYAETVETWPKEVEEKSEHDLRDGDRSEDAQGE